MSVNRWSAGLLGLSMCVAGPVAARGGPARALETMSWKSYGAASGYAEDAGVAGDTALTIAARATPGEPWSSAASLVLPDAVRRGQAVAATFWAKASGSVSAQATIQGGAPDYPVLASVPLALTTRWRRFVVSGVAAAELPAGSQSLTVQLGRTREDVILGPAAVATGANAPARAATALAALKPYERVRDVAIPSEQGVVLAGRLHVPALPLGAPPPPVALLVAGSGPSQRGVFSVLEGRLLAAGIATLDYDKRGAGASSGAFDDRLEPLEHDAGAAVAFLRRQHDVDGTRVAIVGLSQGGMVGPAVAARDPEIAALVMLAGPVGQGTFMDQIQHQFVASGMKSPAAQRAGAALRALLDARVAAAPVRTIGVARAELVDALVVGGWSGEQASSVADTIASSELLSRYAAPTESTLAAVRAPVLALYAGQDENVSTPLSLPLAKAALRGNADATVEEMAGMDHAFRPLVIGASGRPERSPLLLSAPEVVSRITTWVADRLHAKAAQ